ncbi:MAG: pilus assembly PilX N-terminal domain-containing protein [Candidatus Omnitrophota bacterium]
MNIIHRIKRRVLQEQKGAALVILFMVMVVLSIIFVAFMARSISNNRASLSGKDSIQAEALAEAGIDQVKRELYELFAVYYSAQGQSSNAFNWFDDLITDPTNKYSGIPTNAVLATAANASYTVQITNVDTSISVPKYVTLVSTAVAGEVTKKVTAVISYSMSPSKVFDYSYFVNNYGWFWGGGITSQGDIRSNGDFGFNGNPSVNGDVYGSVNPDLGAAGTISGNNKNNTISQYWTQADSAARPTNPTANPQDIDGDGIVETFEYENGYDGNTDEYASQQLLEMPYLGDLTYYKSLAATKNGTIKQGGVTLVNNTHTGNIVLIGTDASPIEIDGPVVVTGDVLIKGKVKGQGTLYSGRNTHVLGDIEYVNKPSWPKPDTDPTATDALNATKDFIGIAAKGNIIVGDYTRTDWQTNVSSYLKPPFTQAYEVDPTDNGIGYVSYTSGGESYFNGNYTVNDGGTKSDGSNRKFYESSYDDTYFRTIAENSSNIRNVDAVMYTNHAFGGKVGAFTMNGSVVSRDEAIIYSGSITMNYDTRAKDKGEEFYLPRALALPHIEYLKKD